MVTTFDTAATEPWTDWSGRTAIPPLVVADTDGIAANPQLLDVNGIHYTEFSGPRRDYQHCNSFDYDENTGHVAINAKAANEFFVIDHDGTFDPEAAPGTVDNNWDTNEVGALARTSAGDFVYRFGMPGNYYQGDFPSWQNEGNAQMYGSHDIQFIEPYHWRMPRAGDSWPAPTTPLPGAGNFLIFDNGCYNPVNRVSKLLEINPYILDVDGNLSTDYVNPPDAGYSGSDSNQIVWSFNGVEEEFYSLHISSVMRLPNGNTFSDAGRKGHFIEVTPDGDLVWEYINPIFGTTTRAYKQQGDDNRNGVFRAYRFGPDHPGFAGVDLTPGATLIEGVTPAERAEDALRLFRTQMMGAQLVE